VRLANVSVARAGDLALPPEAAGWKLSEPLRFTDRPLLIAGSRPREKGEQRVAALAFRLLDSNLPLRVAFPLMISNTIQWLAGVAPIDASTFRAGETVPLDANTSVTLKAEQPGASGSGGPDQSGEFRPLRDGFYKLRANGSERWLAVNTASELESDLRSGVAPSSAGPGEIAALWQRLGSVTGWPLWQLCALAALLLFTGEWWLFHRRRTE
jgi:hypothetical protein